jgi:hypothetical protein
MDKRTNLVPLSSSQALATRLGLVDEWVDKIARVLGCKTAFGGV